MLHQISLYLAEQWELHTVTACLPPHSPNPPSKTHNVSAVIHHDSFHERVGLFALEHMLGGTFLSLIQLASNPVIFVCLFTSGLYPKLTALQKMNLIWNLLWPELHFSKNFPLLNYLPTALLQPVIRIELSGWALQDRCQCLYRTGQNLDEIWVFVQFVWFLLIRPFHIREHSSVLG